MLRVVQTLSTGVDQFRHLPAGVRLYNASGVHTAATAEWVVAAILACQRDFPHFSAARREKSWTTRTSPGLAGATVVIVGAGEIGTAVATRLEPFGCSVQFVARRARIGVIPVDDLDLLLPHADVVVLLVPLTPETDGMVNAEFLARLKPGALLVNASRGRIVDSDALIAELTRRRLRAALDVWDPEPPPRSSLLWSVPGVLLTPHVASNVPGMLERQAALLTERLTAFARGADVPGSRTGGP